MTNCEDLGYEIGDVFEMLEDSNFRRGDKVKLVKDDDSTCPMFQLVSGKGPEAASAQYSTPTAYESLNCVRKISDKAVTSHKLKELAQQSGFQIEFHPDGTVHIWDEVAEEGTKGTLGEIVELAEAKIEYGKVWAKFTWD